jgi:NADPH-dependent curcumin reductase CurA
MDRWGEGVAQMAQWLQEGKIKYREDVVKGFANIPRAFIDMLCGKNTGKMLIEA